MNRNAIYTALFNLASDATGITSTSRWLQPLQDVPTAKLPILIQHQVSDDPKQDKGEPSLNRMKVEIYIYVANPGDGLTNPASAPAIKLNTYLDAIDAALAPDPVTQVQTLGGLVSHAWRTDSNYFEDPQSNRAALVVGIEMLVAGDSSAQFSFDSGTLYALDAFGTPQILGSLQGVDVVQRFETNLQRGNFQYDFSVNRKSAKISMKARFAQIKGAVLAQLVNGLAVSSGSQLVAPLEAHTVPASPGPYTVTITPPSGSWTQDTGVIYDGGSSAGKALTAVSNSPTRGQYAVSGGVYTFASADAGAALSISYVYTVSTGNTVTISNPYSGPTPTFQAVLNVTDKNGNQVTWNLPRCYSDQLGFVTRLEEFAVPDFQFSAMGTVANPPVIGTLSFSQ